MPIKRHATPISSPIFNDSHDSPPLSEFPWKTVFGGVDPLASSAQIINKQVPPMNKLLAASLLVVAATSSAATQSIVQTKTFSVIGGSGTDTITFNQFDTTLGTLTGVFVQSTGTLSGSFTVTNGGAPGSYVTVKDSASMMTLGFYDGPWLYSTALSPVSTSPTSNSTGYQVPKGTTTFTILGSQVLTLSSTDLTADYSAWFSGVGAGTRDADIMQSFGTTLVGFSKSDNYSGVNLAGSVTLTYYYTSPAVPEPSTYGIALGGLALVGAIVRRRKQAK